jgi:hypothetical protein
LLAGVLVALCSRRWLLCTCALCCSDISASAFNMGEQIVCSVIMLLSGMLWGYLVGVFCTLATASPSVQAFRDELSQLNGFCATYRLPSDLRFRLRSDTHTS